MLKTLPRRTFAAALTLAACTAALQSSLFAQTPAGFAERYALADDRGQVVADLIPGTEDWYYYRCRERLDARDFETVRQVLSTWIERHGRTARVIEIENREALLSFGDDRERTYDFLRQRLGLQFDHQAVVPGASSDLPSRIDPVLLSPGSLTRRALARHPGTVNGFETSALARLARSTELDDDQLASLLARLQRPDVTNLPALIARDLARRESNGFGSYTIHTQLRREHLDELLQLRPDLLQNDRFVHAYLERLQPDADIAWSQDADARGAYIQRLWQFVERLTPRFNSLKAHVLYHWLRHDLAAGVVDKQRFIAYIQLPRRTSYAAQARMRSVRNQAEFIDFGSRYPTSLRPIGDDLELLQSCLEHLFASEDGVTAYSNYLDKNWLERVLAETKLLRGEGDMERWYSLLADPAYLEQLENRVELRFPASEQQYFAADEAVSIEVETKNVPTLLVKVFAIDSYRYHIEKQEPVDASIELDGIVANEERTYEYDEPAIRRVRRSFDLPMLREPGTYVVEFVGNGISSRAVVHKGGLRMVERTSAAGHLVRVYDEAGRHLPDAIAWFGGTEYQPDDNGEILVPFSTDPGNKRLVLRHRNRSSLAPFAHRAENYALHDSVYVDREALIAGNLARMVVRPQLRLGDHEIPTTLLEEPVLTIVATDLDMQTTTQEVRGLTFDDTGAVEHVLRVPSRLLSLSVRLQARVEGLDGEKVSLSGNQHTFSFNGIDRTADTGVPLLMHTSGGYAVELRGKSGEVLGGRVCRVTLHHRDYTDPLHLALQTDDAGRIQLGLLPGIERISVARDGGPGGSFSLREAACLLPEALHGSTGQTLRVPYLGERAEISRDEFSLLGHNRDAFEHLALADGFVELRDLPPGDYELHVHRTGEVVDVRITRGARDGELLVGRDRALTASSDRPLQLASLQTTDDALRITLANATRHTRVHVVATRYLPTYHPFARLAGHRIDEPFVVGFDRPASIYHAGRRLGDEYRYVLERRFAKKYPGNMLDRPSLLLNPMTLSEFSSNQWNTAVGLGGGAGGKAGGRGGRRRQGGGPSANDGGGANPGELANLDYLPEGSTLIADLEVGADGVVSVPLADLGPGQHVHVVAVDGDQAVYDTTVRAEQVLQPRSRALPAALDSTKHLVETRSIEFVAAGQTVELDERRAAEVEVHDSLANVYRLLTTIGNDPELQQFAFVLRWPQLSETEKLEMYERHACHELHFFLQQKDPEFFRSVVRPFLANKLDKTFLDEWLLERDLSRYLEPWAFARLNVVEKILLARRIGGSEREAVARNLREALELNPISDDRLSALFDLALNSDQLQEQQNAVTKELERLAQRPADKAFEPDGQPAPSRAFSAGRPSAPAGPATGGAPAAAAPEESEDADARGRVEEKAEGGSDDFFLGRDRAAGLRELAKRKNVRPLYRGVADTEQLVEHNYHQRNPLEPTTDVVPVNRFWVDYALSPVDGPFVSPAIAQASGSFLEMMMALAVTDLPFEAGEHDVATDGDVRRLRAASPMLLVRKEIAPSESTDGSEPLLIGQNLFRLDDRYRFVDGQRRDRFVTDEFLIDVPYGCQVVVTNPTSTPRTTEVLLQVPAGAVPLQSGFWTKGRTVQLQPYATQTIEYAFYFPQAGSFAHYPAHASSDGKLLAAADPATLQVVSTPSKVDTSSWEHVSQQASSQEVLAFLDTHNVQRLDLSRIAWRMRDRAFFEAALQKLEQRHVYDGTLWSYGVLHRDADATREYLRHRDDFLDRCGTWLESPLASIDPKRRLRYQHLELSPLVHQRAHVLGGEREFHNADLAQQYAALMDLLGYRPQLDSKDWLAVTYYFLLQDRVDDALRSFARVDPNSIEARIQYEYLSAYLCFFTGNTQKARNLAEANRDHPVQHWRSRFREVLAHLDEAEGKKPAFPEEQSASSLAATAPALELAIEGTTLAVRYENLAECEVRYYELDVEFAFSAKPFASTDGTSAAFVQPNAREVRSLPDDGEQITFALPAELQQKNVLVEVRAGGLTRSRQYFTNALDVRFLESYGQVAVSEPGGKKPLVRTYVKVFARMPDGNVRFHKDGYTDLRGRFDYASVSDDPNAGAERYAVLVLDEQRGAVIREIAPPSR